MNCIIIDDEPLAIEVIETYLKQTTGIELLATFHNPTEAIAFLSKQQVDLVFLDIQMPNITGIELIKALSHKPKFIFTTAYPQYALDGFELNALDYLVKPIPFHRFLKAIEKVKQFHRITVGSKTKEEFIFVKSEYENVKIKTDDITYIEGLKDYIKIHTIQQEMILTLMNFKEILQKLNNEDFIRIHRSFIVNKSYIKTVQKSGITIENKRIPIGKTYKKSIVTLLKI